MRNLAFAAIATITLTAAVPAAAVEVLTFGFGRISGTANSSAIAVTNSGITLTATARQFSVLPNALIALSQTTATGQIQQTVPGIGVNGGASAPQIDTNVSNLREGILISGSSDFSLRGLRLSFVDNDDTLQVYGVRDSGTLVNLGYPGVIRAALPGGNAALSLLAGRATGSAFSSGTNSGTQSLSLVNPTSYFNSFLFTTRERGDQPYLGTRGQGYRIDTVTVGVPEPESWALLILGFGMVGMTARRRQKDLAS